MSFPFIMGITFSISLQTIYKTEFYLFCVPNIIYSFVKNIIFFLEYAKNI